MNTSRISSSCLIFSMYLKEYLLKNRFLCSTQSPSPPAEGDTCSSWLQYNYILLNSCTCTKNVNRDWNSIVVWLIDFMNFLMFSVNSSNPFMTGAADFQSGNWDSGGQTVTNRSVIWRVGSKAVTNRSVIWRVRGQAVPNRSVLLRVGDQVVMSITQWVKLWSSGHQQNVAYTGGRQNILQNVLTSKY